jgi:hypothetical protein
MQSREHRRRAALARRVLDGHATPNWELQGNLRLLYGNHQEISDPQNSLRYRAAGATLSVNLLNIKERQKPKATKEKSFAWFSARSLWLFCNLLSGSRHNDKQLEVDQNRGGLRVLRHFHRRDFKLHYGAQSHPMGLLQLIRR